jgi:O-antigen/teichoic acid export membrane protein
MSVSLVTFIAQYCDRWIAAAALPESDFALYSFAWTLPLIGQSIQLIINAAVFPLIARRHGTQGPERSFRISAQLSVFAAVTGTALVLPASWLLDLGVRIWLPAYVEAVPLMTVFLFVTVLRISDFSWPQSLQSQSGLG